MSQRIPSFLVDYPPLPNDVTKAYLWQVVSYGSTGPYLVTGISVERDSITIKNMDDGNEFEMVKARPFTA